MLLIGRLAVIGYVHLLCKIQAPSMLLPDPQPQIFAVTKLSIMEIWLSKDKMTSKNRQICNDNLH
jgi:hypothetical protein